METQPIAAKRIELVLTDGTPFGVVVANSDGSTVTAVKSPRMKLEDLLNRPEADRGGVYFLLGPDDKDDSRQRVYVGQTQNFRQRLSNHDRDEDKKFFTYIIMLVSSGNSKSLDAGILNVLESQLIKGIHEAKRAILHNKRPQNNPEPSEGLAIDANRFLHDIEWLLPVLEFEYLKKVDDGSTTQHSGENGSQDDWEFNGSCLTRLRGRSKGSLWYLRVHTLNLSGTKHPAQGIGCQSIE